METIIEIVVGLFEIIIDCIESKLYKKKRQGITIPKLGIEYDLWLDFYISIFEIKQFEFAEMY